MDIVTLGAAKAQTESYVGSHFVAGSNITITENVNGTQTIAASGEVSSEDTVARGDIADHKADKANPHEVTKSQVGLGNVDNTSDLDKPISTATQTALNGKVDAVTGKGLSTNDFTDTLKSKLDGIESGAEVNVQSDWNQTTDTADDYIKNKPSIPQTAADVGAIATTAKGSANGVAELDSNGKVPSSQLPSYVDDVIEGYYYNSKFYKESTHTTEITGETGKIYIDLSGTNKTYRWSGSGYTEISESLALGETSSTAYRGDRGKTAYSHATETRLTTATASGLYKVASTAEGHIASLANVQKSDITGLGIPAQDTTYEFEGTYDASTNKAATMADIKDGKLTGYAQSSGDVAATDKVIEAIGKIEKKADTNETNISKDEAALVELVDSGAKNMLDFNKATSVTKVDEITYSISSDGSLTVTWSGLTSAKTLRFVGIPYIAGELVLSGCPSGGDVFTYRSEIRQIIGGTETNIATDNGAGSNSFELNNDTFIYVVRIATASGTATFKPMLCTKAAWDISHEYEPYALPNPELTAGTIELVDSGAKNTLKFDGLSVTDVQGVNFTLNSNGTITVKRVSAGTSNAITTLQLGGSDVYIDNYCNGKFQLSGCPVGGSSTSYELNVTNGTYTVREYGEGENLPDKGSNTSIYVRIIVRKDFNGEVTFKPMICTKAAWDISQTYQSYRPSYQELYERVVALEQENT